MPAKVERCVEKVMSEQGVEESRAWAICQASTNDGSILNDKAFTLKAKIDDETGFLTAPVNLARVGVQYYMGYELGLTDRLFDRIGVFRSPEEVFHPDSLNTFTNLTATDDHPEALVTVLNVKDLQVGTVSGVSPDKEKGLIHGVLTITDKGTIKLITDGKMEVSVGYTNDLVQESGVYNGDAYEFKQTNIRANHLAVVGAGRCGPECRILTDHSKGEIMKVTIAGITFDTDNEQLAQAIGKMQVQLDQSEEEMKKAEEEKEKAMKDRDAAVAQKDAALADMISEDAINSMVHERAELLATARTVLGDKMPDCNCPKEIRVAVIDHVFSDMDMSGKSDDYIKAMYDMATSKIQKKDENLKRLQDNGKDREVTKDRQAIHDEARNKYVENLTNSGGK